MDESSHIICKVRLVGEWIKRKEVVNGAIMIRKEKLRLHQYGEGYAGCLENRENRKGSRK